MTLSENTAAGAIMNFERTRRDFCMPRYTPAGWWECDVMTISESGYFTEYEVKLSLADFRKDAEKSKAVRGSGHHEPIDPTTAKFPGQTRWVEMIEMKHALLAAGSVRGPNKFFFVAPVGLLALTDLPPWAGLIELHDRGEGHRPSNRWTPHTVVPAPKLHRQKADPKIRAAALGACYYRFHDLLRTVRDRSEPPAVWHDDLAPAESP